MIIFIAAMVYSIKYLLKLDSRFDHWAAALTSVGLLLGGLGLFTGAIWAEYTWGKFWSWDIKQFTTLIALMIYLAYFVLRRSFPDEAQQARISAVYNIFAFAALIPLYFIVPKMLPGLHPTSGDSDAGGGSFIFSREGFDNHYRMIMYPTMLGFILLSVWIFQVRSRLALLQIRLEDHLAHRAYNHKKA